jgi:hypothetical protein
VLTSLRNAGQKVPTFSTGRSLGLCHPARHWAGREINPAIGPLWSAVTLLALP